MPPAVKANQTVEIWQWSYKEDSFRLCLIDAQTNGGSSKSTNIDTLNEIYAFWVIFFFLFVRSSLHPFLFDDCLRFCSWLGFLAHWNNNRHTQNKTKIFYDES